MQVRDTHWRFLAIFTFAVCFWIAAAPGALAQGRTGSIYDAWRGPIGYAGDKTARQVGDIVTVLISESQDLKNEEKTGLQKANNLNYELLNFNIKPNTFNTLPGIQSNSGDNFQGTANYEKKGNFQARLAAIVVDRLPNGNLVVKGRREIRIDQEKKLIEFSGIVRRYDVKPDNTIESELVADARVTYYGRGPLTNATNRIGIGRWFKTTLDWLWPF